MTFSLINKRVVVPVSGEELLDAPPGPAGQGQSCRHAQAQEHRLPSLAVPDPEVAPQPHQGRHSQDDEGHRLPGINLVLAVLGGADRGGLLPLLGPLLVLTGPFRSQGEQLDPRHQPFPLSQVGHGADEGDQGIGPRFPQVVVLEGAQGQVLRPPEPQVHGPGLLALRQPQRVVLRGDLVDPGLGVEGAHLLLDEGTLAAAGQQGDAGGVPGQLQGEGFGDGDGTQEALHPRQGAAPGALRRDGDQPHLRPRFVS